MNKEFWSTRARALTPYVPGEQPKVSGLIKLNTNENPYPPSPQVLDAMHQAVNEQLRLYPDPESTAFRAAVAKRYALKPEQVFAGNGSDEVLSFAFCALLDSGKEIVFPEISYSFYPVYADYYQLTRKIIPMKDDFTIDISAFFHAEGGVVLANPNAPTGIALQLAEIRAILEHNRTVPVIVDEAYVDFGGESAVALIDEFPNLLVVHTLSKYRSLAGLRVGYAMGQTHLISALNTVKNSFNSYPIDRIALAGATCAIEEDAYFQEQAKKVIATRARTTEVLQELGFTVCPSKANFVFARHNQCSGETVYQELRARNILVRHWNAPIIEQYLRISIGTDEEMEALFAALREFL